MALLGGAASGLAVLSALAVLGCGAICARKSTS